MTGPNMLGVAITSLVGSLGAAGAAVAIAYYFLGFLRDAGEAMGRNLRNHQVECKDDRERDRTHRDGLADRYEILQRSFQDQISRMTGIQNTLLRDAILAMKSVERPLELMAAGRDDRLRVVWADDATPFTGAQVADLLRENAELRAAGPPVPFRVVMYAGRVHAFEDEDSWYEWPNRGCGLAGTGLTWHKKGGKP